MFRIFKNLTIINAIILLLFNYGCKKAETLNKLPSAPILLEPQNGSVTVTGDVIFKWQESHDPEGDNIQYIAYFSTDSANWKVYQNYTLINKATFTVPLSYFDQGQKYYWKITSENSFSGLVPSHEEGQSVSNVFYFYTSPPGVVALHDSSGNGFVNLYWTDPVNLNHILITFEPQVSGISQPITLSAGVGKIAMNGLGNGTVYNFYVKAFDQLGHVSKTDTIRSLPLLPIQVHDADFNIYSIVTMGTQTWLRENLRTTKWQDGTSMGNFYYKGSKSDIYGLYYTAVGSKNPCPCEYHVPSAEEWKIFERYLGMPEEDINHSSSNGYIRGGDEKIGFLIKSQTGWSDYMGASGNGSDLYGFNALPSGFIFTENSISSEKELGKTTVFCLQKAILQLAGC